RPPPCRPSRSSCARMRHGRRASWAGTIRRFTISVNARATRRPAGPRVRMLYSRPTIPSRSAMVQRLARRFPLEPDEARRAHALAAIFFALVGSYTLVKTARDADFLAQYPVRVLPYVLMAIGVLTLGATLLFSRLTKRLANGQALAAGAVSCALSLLVFE